MIKILSLSRCKWFKNYIYTSHKIYFSTGNLKPHVQRLRYITICSSIGFVKQQTRPDIRKTGSNRTLWIDEINNLPSMGTLLTKNVASNPFVRSDYSIRKLRGMSSQLHHLTLAMDALLRVKKKKKKQRNSITV